MSDPPRKEGGGGKKPDIGIVVVGVIIFLVIVFSGVIPEFFRQVGYGFQTMRMHGGAILALIGAFLAYKLFSSGNSDKKDDHH